MSHLELCLDELTAEIVAVLDAHESVRALHQLDEREERSEPLTAVDAAALRRQIMSAIDAHPMMQALRLVGELRALVTAAAVPTPRSNVVPLARDPVRRAASKWGLARTGRRTLRVACVMMLVVGIAVIGVSQLGEHSASRSTRAGQASAIATGIAW